jgi:hypothetical protein
MLQQEKNRRILSKGLTAFHEKNRHRLKRRWRNKLSVSPGAAFNRFRRPARRKRISAASAHTGS